MQFSLNISMNNAAFADGNGSELARILAEFAEQIAEVHWGAKESGTFRDLNGNTCGTWKVNGKAVHGTWG